jgi:hypothetical protein
VALLLITTPSLIILAWMSVQGGRGYMGVFVFVVMSMAVLLSPALFDLKDNREELAEYVFGADHKSGIPESAE